MSTLDRKRWDARWRERAATGPGAPEPFLVRHAGALPRGPLLDVAAGDGRNALWLAGRGLPVAAVDVSPTAIARLERAAAAQGLAVRTRAADLDAPDALEDLGTFASLVVIRFRPGPAQWRRLLAALRPGGRVLLCSFGPEQHRRHGFPLAFCLERAELEAGLGRELRLLFWESLAEDGAFLEGSLWEKRGDQAAAVI
ncbi:methyltransferase domain-containing protein [Benzoatithermus flavus]|uniref:Methyltransferase domain-containing protein n=1 Tax=Benzoatithermus flavus TaxID=3108223 RepID=A0ABU8XWM3_9PROT